MGFQLLALPSNISGVTYGVAGLAATIVVIAKLSHRLDLDVIPTVGSSTWLGSWWAGLQFVTNAVDVINEGYAKHKRAPFKVAKLYRWVVVLSSREHLEEVRKASDDELSFMEATNDQILTEYTLGPEIHHNPYHVAIVRSQLTRNIGVLYSGIRDELVTAFDEVLDLRGNEWKSVPAVSAVRNVVCRTSNRVFVGLPLCRNPDWIELNIQFTYDVVKGGAIIGLFPDFMKPLASRYFTSVARSTQRGMKHLGPIIEERRKYLKEYGNEWADRPNDFLSWLMDEAQGPELTIKSLTTRMLTVNFAAIHTTSQSFTQALFYLAANPQYIQPLREEVEAVIETDGWSKAALGKMRKVDSFLRESQRMEGIGIVSMSRKALKDFTFSDGTFLPKGTTISAAARCLHRDAEHYENPDVFEPFRFADLEDDGDGAKHQYVSTAIEYLPFGLGKHACPGRFFAANELKSMLAHVVVSYDVKLENNAKRPTSLFFTTSVIANSNVKVMFRRRVD